MSTTKALIVKPRPCPFCGRTSLEFRAVVFRQWSIHCLNTTCNCKGPNGETMDMAVAKWNTLTHNCIDQRENVPQLQKDYKNPAIPKKIWNAIRALRNFTSDDLIRITGCNPQTIKKYLPLLEENEYVRAAEQENNAPSPKVYHCVKSRTVKAPGWLSLQLTPRDYEIYRQEKKSLKWKKVTAVIN